MASCAMHRGINNVEVFLMFDGLFVDTNGLNGFHEVVVHFATDNFDKVFVATELNVSHGYFVHLVDDTDVVRHKHL